MHGRLEDSEHTDDSYLLSQSYRDMFEKIGILQAEATTAVLKINSKKTNELCMNSNITYNLDVSDIVIEIFKEFTYLGSLVMVGGGELLRC